MSQESTSNHLLYCSGTILCLTTNEQDKNAHLLLGVQPEGSEVAILLSYFSYYLKLFVVCRAILQWLEWMDLSMSQVCFECFYNCSQSCLLVIIQDVLCLREVTKPVRCFQFSEVQFKSIQNGW